MLKINLDTDINNIAFLEYMREQEEKAHQKVNVYHSDFWGVSSPPKADIENGKNKNPEIYRP